MQDFEKTHIIPEKIYMIFKNISINLKNIHNF